MSKWALWAAHRYVHAGAAVPRMVGPDGKLLTRTWRMPSEQAKAVASMARANRAQPWWPRPLGFACLGIACIAALDPIGSMPTDVAASSAHAAAYLMPPRAIAPAGETPLPSVFRWRLGDACAPFTWILLDAAYQEVARVDGIDSSEYRPRATRPGGFAPGQIHHWYVVGDSFGRPVASPLQTFRIL